MRPIEKYLLEKLATLLQDKVDMEESYVIALNDATITMYVDNGKLHIDVLEVDKVLFVNETINDFLELEETPPTHEDKGGDVH
jgi:hypothetical protein